MQNLATMTALAELGAIQAMLNRTSSRLKLLNSRRKALLLRILNGANNLPKIQHTKPDGSEVEIRLFGRDIGYCPGDQTFYWVNKQEPLPPFMIRATTAIQPLTPEEADRHLETDFPLMIEVVASPHPEA